MLYLARTHKTTQPAAAGAAKRIAGLGQREKIDGSREQILAGLAFTQRRLGRYNL
jgi:hypothetical protein